MWDGGEDLSNLSEGDYRLDSWLKLEDEFDFFFLNEKKDCSASISDFVDAFKPPTPPPLPPHTKPKIQEKIRKRKSRKSFIGAMSGPLPDMNNYMTRRDFVAKKKSWDLVEDVSSRLAKKEKKRLADKFQRQKAVALNIYATRFIDGFLARSINQPDTVPEELRKLFRETFGIYIGKFEDQSVQEVFRTV